MTELDALTEVVDQLVASDPSLCADAESIEQLYRQQARVESFVTQATASFDVAGTWVTDGARKAAAWITKRCRLPKTQGPHRFAPGIDVE